MARRVRSGQVLGGARYFLSAGFPIHSLRLPIMLGPVAQPHETTLRGYPGPR